MCCCCDEFGVFLVVLLSCYDVIGQSCKPKDCVDLKCYRVSTATKGANIYPDTTPVLKLKVTCDQSADGGGWISYLRRLDGSVPFNKSWAQYRDGFGEQGENKESWLGNENVYQLVKHFKGAKAQLRLEGHLFDGRSCYFTSDDFRLESETGYYRLHFGKTVVVGSNNDDWSHLRNARFCMFKSGAWWRHNYAATFLTGYYTTNRIFEDTASGNMYILNYARTVNYSFSSLKAAYMMFRPMESGRPCRNPCNRGTCEHLEKSNSHRCVCLSTHCGPKCEADPCKNRGSCLYNSKTKKISCMCVSGFKGRYCNETVATTITKATTATTATIAAPTKTNATVKPKATVTIKTTAATEIYVENIVAGITSLLLLLVIIAIVICCVVVKRRREEKKKEKEEERQRLLMEQESSYFDSFLNSFY